MSLPPALAELSQQYQNEYKELQKLQVDMQKFVQTKSQFTAQLNENQMVKKELELLDDGDAKVYKLIGPVLVQQDLVEARANVNKRLEFIQKELNRTDATLAEIEKKANSKRERMLQIQTSFQREQAKFVQQQTSLAQ
eukprot:GEZU01030170.1.p1 GENE.GEZU01030170.1~~GEZU01030170.1.p1  ORF type:complete len:146 (+),score=59.34 GEZU01030170.1:27-440(+)